MYISFYILSILFIELKFSKVEVKVKEGTIIGAKENTVFDQKRYFAFYGVPYAKPPIGRLRFENPKPIKKYLKIIDASTEYHGACAQAHIIHKHALFGNEDCLYLNIYTPFLPLEENQKLKAVVVWIHGYAFSSSFSHIHGPDFLIEHDVIFISLTHRIGPFGFLKLNDSDSNINMGLKDIIIGLKWIRNNIKSLGGDKNKITLMGSGSGGSFALLLLLTKYRKLFHKLIIQSGTMFSPSMFQGSNVLERHKLQHELEKEGHKNIIAAPTQAIVSAINKIYTTKDMLNSQRPLIPFSPVLESESNSSLLTQLKFNAFDHNKNEDDINTPILIGFSMQESISELIPFIHNPTHLNSLGENFKYIVPYQSGCSYNYSSKVYKLIANKILKRYFQTHPKITIEELLTFTSDIHKYPIYKFLRTYLKQSLGKMYVYKFNYTGKFNAVKLTSIAGSKIAVKGAAQGDEICYILKCEPLWESYVKIKSDIKSRDRKFIKQLTSLWSNFAKFENPTPSNYFNITWPPMTSEEDNVLLFGRHSKIIDSKEEMNMYEFWNNLYDDYYSPKRCRDKHDEL